MKLLSFLKYQCSFLSFILFLTVMITPEVKAQFVGFGKNRVQFHDFEWRYLQSKHFDVYYYGKKNYYLASFTAQALEASYKQISEDFRHEISDRITIIVYDSHNDFAQTNVVELPVSSEGIGGVTEAFKNRIALPFMGDYGDYRRVVHHELIHAVINDMFYGGSIQAIIQNNIQLVIPNWFNEGMAEFSALGFDTDTDNFLRDATLNNYMPPIQYLYGYFWYRGGQSVWNYIQDEYGREKIGEIFQKIKTTRSVEMGFRQSIGLSVEELSEKWLNSLKKHYWPEVAIREDINEVGTTLSKRESGGSYNTSPAISPQGDKVALITNQRGYFDVIVVSAITGKKIKTLIKGEDNIDFEELNILNPNLSWSPNGAKIALSTKSLGLDVLAIVDYATGKVNQIRFPMVDAIGTVSWSPDGKKIAFSGNIGSFPDIFVYNLETKEFYNITNDVFTDKDPMWTPDAKSVLFASDRGDKVTLNSYKEDYNMLLNPNLSQFDLYQVSLGASKAERLTETPDWSEQRPFYTNTGRLVFLSDQNGINNVYEMNPKTLITSPVTDLQQGILQMSVSADGSRMAVNTYNGGYVDVFLLKNPLATTKSTPLTPNRWAMNRDRTSKYDRVPALGYAFQMFGTENYLTQLSVDESVELGFEGIGFNKATSTEEQIAKKQETEEKPAKEESSEFVDFRNYTFGEIDIDDEEEETFTEESPFTPDDNLTEGGIFKPKDYRLKFAPEFTYLNAGLNTFSGTFGLTQFVMTDVLGDHRITVASNLVFDLRNSTYIVGYEYRKNRTNIGVNYFHFANRFQTLGQNFSLELVRFRTYGLGVSFQYPLNKFQRIDYGVQWINIARDLNNLSVNTSENDLQRLLYPSVTFTSDFTRPGFITPSGGSRYSVTLSASPPMVGNAPRFGTLNADYRTYFGLGYGYGFAFRGSAGFSAGPEAQTFLLGGVGGWINIRWDGNQFPVDQLADLILTQPAIPLRGYPFNASYGSRFSLFNAEFRFPLFAALLPGPIPIIPLYNITGTMFADLGAAWGLTQTFSFRLPSTGEQVDYYTNEAGLDLTFSKDRTIFIDPNTGSVVERSELNPNINYNVQTVRDGDLLLGVGFGLRTIMLGLPVRWDLAWPRDGSGLGRPIHYFSIGIDF